MTSTPLPPRVTALTLARATAEFQKITSALIQALVAQAQTPTADRARLIAELEVKRDDAHDYLNRVEAEYARVLGR